MWADREPEDDREPGNDREVGADGKPADGEPDDREPADDGRPGDEHPWSFIGRILLVAGPFILLLALFFLIRRVP